MEDVRIPCDCGQGADCGRSLLIREAWADRELGEAGGLAIGVNEPRAQRLVVLDRPAIKELIKVLRAFLRSK